MKKLTYIFILLFCFILMSYCSSNEAELNSTNGTVKYISLEGGFYGIITDKNEHLDPINLSKEFQVDGKRVTFRYIIRTDLASFHMWGAIIEIIEIKEMK